MDINNKHKLRNAQATLSNGKEQAKEKWLYEKLNEMQRMHVHLKNAWKAIKNITKGIFKHHKNAMLMQMQKQDRSLAKNKTKELLKA